MLQVLENPLNVHSLKKKKKKTSSVLSRKKNIILTVCLDENISFYLLKGQKILYEYSIHFKLANKFPTQASPVTTNKIIQLTTLTNKMKQVLV